MSARREMAGAALVLLCSAVCLGACAHADGVDASAATAAKVDPEVEPLPPSPKRRMRDPRGVPVFDAGGASAAPETTSDASVVAAPVVAAPVVATCGATADPCPMQRFMHDAMETAHTPDTLTAAFTRAAGMSPDPAWSWVAIATRGAELANAGDLAAAKAQCKACHDAYREPYRQLHRIRRL